MEDSASTVEAVEVGEARFLGVVCLRNDFLLAVSFVLLFLAFSLCLLLHFLILDLPLQDQHHHSAILRWAVAHLLEEVIS